jgi:hypothetical protein
MSVQLQGALDVARRLRDEGGSPIPLTASKKPPARFKWEPFQGRRATDAELERWFGNGNPNGYLVGLVTGAISSVVVLDGDNRDGDRPRRGPYELQQRGVFESPVNFRWTPHGVHVYYEHPGYPVPISEGERGWLGIWGVDVRGDGGYVVYFGPGYRPGLDGARAQLPEWARPQTNGHKAATPGTTDEPWITELMLGVSYGERDRACTRLAGYFLGKGMAPDIVESVLVPWAGRCEQPLGEPFGASDVHKVVESIAKAEQAKGKQPGVRELNLPAEFWGERPALAQIRDAAWSRQRSPDAVFHCVLSRVAATVPHQLRLPPIVGSAQPLCYFAVLMGAPGSGKSTTNTIAAEVVPVPVYDVRPGSGEGLVEAYLDFVDEDTGKDKTKRVKRQVRNNAHIYVDEGAVLAAFSMRSGNTTLATMRSMWSGESVGQDNARDETKRRLPKGSYTLGMVVALQEELAEPLLSDAPAGTPQRFGWARTTDPSIPEPGSQPEWPGALGWTSPELGQSQMFVERAIPPGDQMMGVDEAVQREIKQTDYARATGQVQADTLDAHAGLVRLRIAALLALLDGGRLDVDADDWRLAGVVLSASDRVRAHAQAAVAVAQEAHSRHRGERRGIEDAAAETAREKRRTVERAEWIGNCVWAEPDRWTRRDLRNQVRSDRRGEYDEGLAHAVAEGWVVEVSEPGTSDDPKRALRPGRTKPPRGRK